MKNQLIKDLEKLTAFQTTSDKKGEMEKCFDFIKERLKNLPFEIEEFTSRGKKSVLWKSKKSKTNILLNAHIDVVPGPLNMFDLRIQRDRLLGRGVSDMKFSIACYINLLETVYKKNKGIDGIDLLITSDEEIGGSNGVGYFVKHFPCNYDLVITPDGGDNFKIVEKGKGVLSVSLTSNGISAHGSRPWEGKSAIDIMLNKLSLLRRIFPEEKNEKWITTINIGTINGGVQSNQVANECTATLDIRYIPEDGAIKIKKILSSVCNDIQIQYLVTADIFLVDKRQKYINLWNKLLIENSHSDNFMNSHGASDGRCFSAIGIPVLICKPIGGFIHSDKEWLSYNSLTEFNELLNKYVNIILGPKPTFEDTLDALGHQIHLPD